MATALTKSNGGGGAQSPIAADLSGFGLLPGDVDARPLTQIDMEALGLAPTVQGYRIPYYDIAGTPLKHFRIRQLPFAGVPGDKGSFLRASKDVTKIYFPLGFADVQPKQVRIHATDSPNGEPQLHTPLVLVEDERLAANVLKKHGYLSVAIQGPSGWQTHAGLADGFRELCERCVDEGLTIVLWIGDGRDRNIQREVANLAMEFKFHGVPFKNIRQYTEDKLLEAYMKEVLSPLSRFPRHPSIRQYIQDKIGDTGARLTRKDNSEVALAMLADMEARGTRIRSSTTGDFYYFDRQSKELIRASLGVSGKELMENSDFMSGIYSKYGVSPNDQAILRWFSTQFMAEEPIYKTTSYRVMMCEPRQTSTFALQVTPSELIHLADGKPAEIRENGDFGILFERAGVKGLDVDVLKDEIEKQRAQTVLPMWWLDVVKEVRLNKSDQFRLLLSLLYYVSPWLKGWREIQLPIEVVTGEAGTGKSSLFALRLNILTGDPELQGLPDSVRGWHTAVVNTSGICVFDNVHLANKVHRQSLSDEMCRLVTEPKPTISMRQLYKTADIAKLPVQCTFALTSIENVFTNIDFIQRSIIIHLDRAYDTSGGDEVLFGGWVEDKLKSKGGREAWLAHHIVSLERFFSVVAKQWNPAYKSKTRLINFEQALVLMGKVFGLDVAGWLPEMLQDNSRATAIDIDWVLEGLNRFIEERKRSIATGDLPDTAARFTAADVVDWAITQDDFDGNVTLTNARRLGRYIGNHKTVVRQTTGIIITSSEKRGAEYAIAGSSILINARPKLKKKTQGTRVRPRRDDGDVPDARTSSEGRETTGHSDD